MSPPGGVRYDQDVAPVALTLEPQSLEPQSLEPVTGAAGEELSYNDVFITTGRATS